MEEQEIKKTGRFKFRMPKFRKITVSEFIGWWGYILAGWKEYFVSFPARMKSLTRREIRVKTAKYLLAIVVTYFIVGIILGCGFYLKRIPLNNSFGLAVASAYPFPAETVGLSAVTMKDVADQESIIYFYADAAGSSLGDRLEVDSQVMESLEEVRLAQKALGEYGMKVTNDEVDEVMTQIEEENGGKEQVSELLESLYGMTIEEFKSVVENQLAKDKVSSEILKTVKVRHILMDDEGKAKELKEKITKGEINFEQAAKDNSKDSSTKDSGGLVVASESSEYVGRDSGLADEFVAKAYSMNKGDISDPVKTEYGWHIIYLEDVKGSIDKSYSDWLTETRDKTIIWKLYRP